uniref:Uncharacterized protein n=1 Tax=Oryza brachyantha TaxID=4533 RepID=J3L187_ORYBR
MIVSALEIKEFLFCFFSLFSELEGMLSLSIYLLGPNYRARLNRKMMIKFYKTMLATRGGAPTK